MVFIALGLAGLAAFVRLSIAAGRGSDSARVDAILVAALMVTAAGVAALGSLWLTSWRCDESCDPAGDHWWDTVDAWQWPVQAVVALLGFVAIAAALTLTIQRHHRGAVMAMAGAAISFGVWALFLFPLD